MARKGEEEAVARKGEEEAVARKGGGEIIPGFHFVWAAKSRVTTFSHKLISERFQFYEQFLANMKITESTTPTRMKEFSRFYGQDCPF